jgi:drug/metabolite transporter (DMT)-like permease
MNVLIMVLAAVFSFLHMFIADSRMSWYCLVVERNLIIMFMVIIIYRITPFKHGTLKKLLKVNLLFWIVRVFMSTLDSVLLYFKIDFHFSIMISFGLPLLIILIYSYFILGENNGKEELEN